MANSSVNFEKASTNRVAKRREISNKFTETVNGNDNAGMWGKSKANVRGSIVTSFIINLPKTLFI